MQIVMNWKFNSKSRAQLACNSSSIRKGSTSGRGLRFVPQTKLTHWSRSTHSRNHALPIPRPLPTILLKHSLENELFSRGLSKKNTNQERYCSKRIEPSINELPFPKQQDRGKGHVMMASHTFNRTSRDKKQNLGSLFLHLPDLLDSQSKNQMRSSFHFLKAW